MREIPQ
jgi:hypothetical protein